MLERLDRFPDAVRQVQEIARHYGRIGRQREDERILELRGRAFGPDKDKKALEELEEILTARGDRAGVPEEEQNDWAAGELKRLKQKAVERGKD